MAPSSSGDFRETATLESGKRAPAVAPFPLFGEDCSEADALTAVIRRLSAARTMTEVMAVTSHAARGLVKADGVTFVLRDGDLCHYADEDAVEPLWKGRKFPIDTCISGWVIERGQSAIIPDIRLDERIPQDAYRPTFVRSLAMVPIRQEEPIGAMGAYWSTTHTATGEELDRLQTIANAAALAVAYVQRCEAEAALRDRASMLDALLDHVPEGITIARGPEVTIERVSAEGLKHLQRAETDVTGIGAERHPDAWQVFDEAGTRLLSADELPLTRAARHGEKIENEKLNLKLPDGRLLPILCNAGPIRDANGEVTGGIIAWRDISDLVMLEESLQLLVGELNHRAKNLFAIVSGMIGLTARSSDNVDEMAAALTGRLAALAKAHDLIGPAAGPGRAGTRPDLGDLLRQLLSPHFCGGPDQCRIEGPEVSVGTGPAISLALVVNELATNAVKHGALSTASGKVEIEWAEENGLLVLNWNECGGPELHDEPDRSGFGSKLVDATVKRRLGGDIGYEWEAAGLRVRISVPLKSLEN